MKSLDNVFDILIERLNAGEKGNFSVYGNSMYPTIKDGQIVTICTDKNYNIGDIIAYYVNNHIIVHRIIFVRKNYVLTKGDNNNYIDPLRVLKERIIGKVEQIK